MLKNILNIVNIMFFNIYSLRSRRCSIRSILDDTAKLNELKNIAKQWYDKTKDKVLDMLLCYVVIILEYKPPIYSIVVNCN
jgi:hypothetical protein